MPGFYEPSRCDEEREGFVLMGREMAVRLRSDRICGVISSHTGAAPQQAAGFERQQAAAVRVSPLRPMGYGGQADDLGGG